MLIRVYLYTAGQLKSDAKSDALALPTAIPTRELDCRRPGV